MNMIEDHKDLFDAMDAMQEKRLYAQTMNDRITNSGVETVDLEDRDWIILRLLFLLYKDGRHASSPEAHRIIRWFNSVHEGYGQEVMLAAFSKLAGEARVKGESMYEPFWKKGKWE
jgi:hypothetical protein